MLVLNSMIDKWWNEGQCGVLFYCLVPEGQCLFYTLPENVTAFYEAMAAHARHFVNNKLMSWCVDTHSDNVC